jgi:FkbM family methyltransferase
VIDFGASVDDLAIYFVLHGARKVIALGPLPSAANCAEENFNTSGLAERIKIANAVPGRPSCLRCRVTTVLTPR